MDLTLDLSYLKMLSDGDIDFIATILETFVEEIPKDIKGIKDAVEIKDNSQIGKLAHKTKSSLHTLGFAELKEMAFEIEQKAKKDTTNTMLLSRVDTFTTQLEKATHLVSQKLTSLA